MTLEEINIRLRNLKARTTPYYGHHDPETKKALTNKKALELNARFKAITGHNHECVTRYILNK